MKGKEIIFLLNSTFTGLKSCHTQLVVSEARALNINKTKDISSVGSWVFQTSTNASEFDRIYAGLFIDTVVFKGFIYIRCSQVPQLTVYF